MSHSSNTNLAGGDPWARLQALEDLAALHALKARYSRAADAKYTADGQRHTGAVLEQASREQANCFTEDGYWEGGSFGGDLTGREALYQNFLRAPWRYAMHFYQAPDIRLQGDTAVGSWLLWQIAVRADSEQTELLHGRTLEHYRRTSEGWLISRMRFDSLHSVCVATDPQALRCLIPGLPGQRA